MINTYGLRLDKILDQVAGSYMKTVRYKSSNRLLCPQCGGFKSPEYSTCRSCELISKEASAKNMLNMLADRTAAGIYAIEPDSQALKMMYGYKEARPSSPDYQRNVRALIALAAVGHGQCLEVLSGVPVTAWAMVPSTKSSTRYGIEHPLHSLIAGVMPRVPEIRLESRSRKSGHFDPDAFALVRDERKCNLRHVLLIDDSWVTGGTVQSAAARLKLSGALQVSIYCVARIVDMRYLNSIGNYTPSFQKNVRYMGGYCPWNRCVESPVPQSEFSGRMP